MKKPLEIPTLAQQEVVDLLFRHGFWARGRGAGKSWLRMHLIKRLREAERLENRIGWRAEEPEL